MNEIRPAAGRGNGNGPLKGVRVVEMEGVGPVPFASMLLADMGAEIVTIGAPPRGGPDVFAGMYDPMKRGRAHVALDLKQPGKAQRALDIIARADILLEGFRPGVMERLGLGPDVCSAVRPSLVYGRMTGYGQTGPLAMRAGHDPNYIALVGVLDSIGPADGRPTPPLNLVGDFAGGSLYLALGVMAALLHARETGEGQVVDAAVIDGAASLMTMTYALRGGGLWTDGRERNLIDGGSPYSRSYETRDGRYVVVAAAEEKFYRTLLAGMGLSPEAIPDRNDPANWPSLRDLFAAIFRTRTRDEWVALFEGKDACLSAVLDLAEAPVHPHAVAREAFVARGNTMVPNVAPRFSKTPSRLAPDEPVPAAAMLRDWGVDERTCALIGEDRA